MAIEQLHERYKEKIGFLEDERTGVDEMWTDISKVLIPSLALYLKQDKKSQVEKEHSASEIYDGNPVVYHQLLADGIFGNMCPPNTKWVQTMPRNHKLSEERVVKMWDEIATEGLLNTFSVSNFYDQMAHYIHVGTGVGTATMFQEYEPLTGKYWYHSRHPAEIYIDQDEHNVVHTIYRLFEMSAHLMVKMFGEENVSIPVREASRENPYKSFKVVHVIEPREDSFEWRQRTNKFWPWTNDYFEYDGAQQMLREGGYRRFPAAVWRWRVDGPEKYGRSPAWDAYYDIRSVNEMSKTMLKAAQMAADPPINIPIEQEGKVQNIPHGVNYYEDPGRVVQPFDTRINYPIGVDALDRKLTVLQKHFMVDFFVMLANATSRMTAYEVAERQAEKVAVLGATIGKFSKEGLDAVCDMTLKSMLENGHLPPPPPQMRTEGDVQFDYLGVLAMAQKRQVKGQGMSRAIAELGPVFQLYPDAVHKINWDEYIARVLELNGAPVEVIRDEKEVAKIKEEIQKRIEAQAQAENAKNLGAAMGPGGINQPVEEGTPAEALLTGGGVVQ
jgi:hypothetical protein